MEPLFRLVLMRPAVAQDPEVPSLSLVQDSPFQHDLTAAAADGAPARDRYQALARAFVASGEFIGDPAGHPRQAELGVLAENLDELTTVSHAKVVAAIRAAFGGRPLPEIVNDQGLLVAARRLRDSLIAVKLLQEEHHRPIEALAQQVRDIDLIARVGADDGFPGGGPVLTRYRRRSLFFPPLPGLDSVLSTAGLEAERRAQQAAAEAARQATIEELLASHQALRQAVSELTGLRQEHFLATNAAAHEGFTPPAALESGQLAAHQVGYVRQLADLNLQQLSSGPIITEAPAEGQVDSGTNPPTTLATALIGTYPRAVTGAPAFRPTTLADVGFRVSPDAVAALSTPTQALLEGIGIVLPERPLDQVVNTLQTRVRDVAGQLAQLHAQSYRRSVTRVGDVLVSSRTPVPTSWSSVFVGGEFAMPFPLPQPPVTESVPRTRGSVAPAGVADLLVIKQQLVGYEGTDVAHVENVLKGESKGRDHMVRHETQQVTFTETEVTKEQEQELQSTDRFEMSRTANQTISEDASVRAGLTLSGKYGPTVDFSASAEGSASRSKQEATQTATTFSQEVTQRSASKITERALRRASTTITDETIETNTHRIDNSAGSGHISGVYQWVDKIYQAQMYNYGLRTMFEFMVPEPAAFWIAAQNAAPPATAVIEKPVDFTLTPEQIDESNYNFWVLQYRAGDVAPPPEPFITKSFDFKAGGGDDHTDYNQSGQIVLDEGYEALQGVVGRVVNTWGDADLVDVVLGRHSYRFSHNSPWIWVTPLDGEVGSISWALDTFKASSITVAGQVKCRRTERAMVKWRLETHGKLAAAYQARLSEYEEKVSAAQFQAGVQIGGKNPATNLRLMKDELKKNCISIITDQYFDLFDAIDTSWLNGLPQLDVHEAGAEGSYVRFFEQAFEWDEITWVTYPYFWGRKAHWVERLGYDDPDPLFNDFLKAGYCRVVVPARPGFEGAIDHFISYGELWNGGPLPTISGPLYLPIADELAEQLQRPGDEVPQGDPWEVRIPTALVKLRPDDALPHWEQDQDGGWHEA